MVILPLLSSGINRVDEIRIVLFGMKPGVPIHEFIIAIGVIVAISVFFYFRWKNKSGE